MDNPNVLKPSIVPFKVIIFVIYLFNIGVVIIYLYLNQLCVFSSLCNNLICDKGIRCILMVTLNGYESESVWVFVFGFLGCNVISRVIYGLFGLDL